MWTTRLGIADEERGLKAGDAVRVDPDTARQLDCRRDSQMVIVGAPYPSYRVISGDA